MNTIQTIFQPYNEGTTAIYLSGRSIYDLELNEQTGKIQPIIEILKSTALNNYNLLVIRYSLSVGVEIDTESLNNDEKQSMMSYLQNYNILNFKRNEQHNENEFQSIIRSIYRLASSNENNIVLRNGKNLKFLFLFEFAQHQIPGGLSSGYRSHELLLSRELCYVLSNSLTIRKSGHYIVFNSVGEELIDEMVSNSIKCIRIPQPNIMEKKNFIKALQIRYPNIIQEKSLNEDIVANLTSNTPNKSLERLYLASHKAGVEITSLSLTQQKQQDVQVLSEGTLSMLDIERVKNVSLKGKNIQPAINFLIRCAEGIKTGNSYTPMNILLVGAPASGKTDIALLTAVEARIPAFQINSPKTSLVGQTEKMARIQMTLLKEMNPNLGFIDEITEAFPLSRNTQNLDSGASAAVTAQLLTALSDKSRSGKSIIIATSNCPWKVGSAMISRFTCVPLLMPLEEDFPQILVSIAKNLFKEFSLSENDETIIKSAKFYYSKNASPRTIFSSLSSAIGIYGKLDAETLCFAANDICQQDHRDRMGSIYADLWAIKVTSSQSFLPWKTSQNYKMPKYIQDVIDGNGDIDVLKLDQAIKELEPYVNV